MLSAAAQKILEDGAAKVGLGDKLPLLSQHAREAILIETKVAQTPLRLGQSRLAGRPDLPVGCAWPQDKGVDLIFVAQINLAELPPGPARDQLPARGHLYFFGGRYTLESDLPEISVMYHPGDDLVAAEQIYSPPPVKMGFWKWLVTPSPKGFRLCEITFRAIPSLPQLDQVEGAALDKELGKGEKVFEAYYELLSEFTPDEYCTKLLGHADQIQNSDLGLESQVAFEKIEHPGNIYTSRTLDSQRKAAADWTLLFQLGSDDNANMMWGDAGCLYFMIRRQDLAAARFDAVYTIGECF